MLGTMAYLGLDCSSPYLALALYDGGLLATVSEYVGRNHAQRLTSALDALFARAGRTPGDLRSVCVGVGPGSYTGLRVGVAAARGIARGLGVPLRGESTLAAIAAGILNEDQPNGIVALDARRGNVYAGVFQWREGELERAGGLFKAPRDTLSAQGLPYFEDIPPDAGYLARRGALGANTVAPLYL